MVGFAGIKQHFRKRFGEWIVGAGLFGWGIGVFLAPPEVLAAPIYISMARMGNLELWASIAVMVGALRLVFLVINGAWRKSAHLRAIGSGLSAVVFAAMLGSYLTTGMIIPNIFLVLPLLVADIQALWYATEEAASSDIKRDNLKKSKVSVQR